MLLYAVGAVLLTPVELILMEKQRMKFFWKKLVYTSFVAVLALFAVSLVGIAPVGAADHGQLVGETPRRNVPVVLDGDVRAHAQIGCLLYTSPSPRDS